MEEYVIKLAELQAELDNELIHADFASASIDARITDLKKDLSRLEKERDINRQPYTEAAEELKTTIGDLHAAIIDEWTGEHKTLVFDGGTLKFTQRGSLKIIDELYLFAELYDHVTIDELVKKYLKGFNLTAVKKYMGVHELPIDVAEIEYKTTVKLEQESG